MSKETLEQLSSFVDGELSQDSALFLARRLASDSELGKTWERYHLIRECMRRPGEALAVTSISVDLDIDSSRSEVSGSAGMPGWLKPWPVSQLPHRWPQWPCSASLTAALQSVRHNPSWPSRSTAPTRLAPCQCLNRFHLAPNQRRKSS